MKRFTPTGLFSLAAMALLVPPTAPAQTAAKPAEPPKPAVLVLSPATAPVPALKYRLLPSFAELNPGDAAPIYLRAHGYEDSSLNDAWRQITEKSKQWQELPIKDLPTAEVRKFVNLWSGKLKQIEFGTRRKTCDWNYTLPEQRLDAIGILLPDVQSMREWGRVLALKARVEIAEGKYDEAIRTIETGLAFARHVGDGPFFINGLVGIAIANLMLAPCEDLIARPGAPNLYWALTTLPRPLVNVRNHMEAEQKMIENLIPELAEAELARPRTNAEWTSLLSRMHAAIIKWSRNMLSEEAANQLGLDLASFKNKVLAGATASFQASRKSTPEQLAAMSEDQMVALCVADGYRTLWDDLFKASYLPFRVARTEIRAADTRLHAAKSGPLAFFVGLIPAVESVMMMDVRLDRRVAILRVIEALRLYSAAHNGALPESLSQINEAPVPNDPVTETAFEYRRDGSSALLSCSPSTLPHNWEPAYRITMRH
jgi:hypothetical protein